jgi:hypothetical protein
MLQQGQVFELATRGRDGKRLWAYRYRAGGRDASGSGASAGEAPPRTQVREKAHLAGFVDEYLTQHEVSPVMLAKLRFLLSRAVRRSKAGTPRDGLQAPSDG